MQQLMQADRVKTADHPQFVRLMNQLVNEVTTLSPQQQMHLRYLQAWEVGYQGDFKRATPLLNAVIAESTDATLRFRAGTTLVNMLSIGSRYEEAFVQVNRLLDQLPQITAKDARIQGLGVASLLFNEAGQYELGLSYANKMLQENPVGDGNCKGQFLLVQSMYGSSQFATFGERASEAIEACNKAADFLFANAVRFYVASFDTQHGRSSIAIRFLLKHYAEVQHIGYPAQIAEFSAVLAQAYWNDGKITLAQKYALATVDGSVKHEFTKSLISAYYLLYMINKKQGDLDAALAYHEKYMAADKGYLNSISAKALAYQTVKQQVLAKKLQVAALNKENRILQLQQALSKKDMEASRLWIILLLSALAFIGFLTYRIRRSQLSFMRLARRDGLTGIYNRQHFLAEAERQLRYCQKSSREVCLVLIDLDHFKVVNDTFGHATGDRVLKRAVEVCQKNLRSTDVFGRLGGEEFGILLPECSLEQVSARVEVLRLAVASVAMEDVLDVQVSGSFGIAATESSGYELRELLSDADDALYQAKHDGRNRAVVFDASKSEPTSRQKKSRSGEAATGLPDHA